MKKLNVYTSDYSEIILCFRSDLRVFNPQGFNGELRYTIYDPVTDLSYFLGENELTTARLFNGQRSLQDIVCYLENNNQRIVTINKLTIFANRLSKLGLLENSDSKKKSWIRDPAMGISYGPLKSLLLIPIMRIDPNAFLKWTYCHFPWICSSKFIALGLVAISMAVFQIISNHEVFWHDVVSVYGGGTRWLLWHYPIVVVSIFFHEIGHALTCYAYRVRITDFGVAIYLLLATGWARPLQSDWDKASKPQRITAIVMGPYASLLFATVGVIIWTFAQKSSVYNTLGVVMAVSSLLSLIPTLLPIFNGDTYLMITEMFGVPRLRQKSFRYAKNLLHRRQHEQSLSARIKFLYWVTILGNIFGFVLGMFLLLQFGRLVLIQFL